jgi:hypothetical protein
VTISRAQQDWDARVVEIAWGGLFDKTQSGTLSAVVIPTLGIMNWVIIVAPRAATPWRNRKDSSILH